MQINDIGEAIYISSARLCLALDFTKKQTDKMNHKLKYMTNKRFPRNLEAVTIECKADLASEVGLL